MKITSFAITVAAAQVPYVASQVKRLRSKDQRSKATGATVEWGRNQAEAVVQPHRARAVPKNNVLPVSSAKENEFVKSDARSKATGATVEWGRNQAEAVVHPHRARAIPKNNVLPVSSAKENQFLKSDAFDQSYNYGYPYDYGSFSYGYTYDDNDNFSYDYTYHDDFSYGYTYNDDFSYGYPSDHNYTYDDDLSYNYPSESPGESECGSGCPDGFTGTLPLKNCEGYYYCISGEPMHPFNCPAGTLYSDDRMHCIWKDQVTCSCTDGSPPPVPSPAPMEGCGSGCPNGFTGRLPKLDCDEYYYCLNGHEVSENECTPGTKFDSTVGQCIWAHSATCDCVSGNNESTNGNGTDYSSPTPSPTPGGQWTMDWGRMSCVSGDNPPHWKTRYPTQQECCKAEAGWSQTCMTPPVAVSAVE